MVDDWAVIFDVDGVLLELTRAEEELFFQPFASRMDASVLSRDWNTYAIRNDEEIVREIVHGQGWPASEAHLIKGEYLNLLQKALHQKALVSEVIEGAEALLKAVEPHARLGIATANFLDAARLRLKACGLWKFVSSLAFGADGGGHKSDVLARAITACGLTPSRIIYVGDNVNDVVAGLANTVHFIGFSRNADRRKQLSEAGALTVHDRHSQTLDTILNLITENRRPHVGP